MNDLDSGFLLLTLAGRRRLIAVFGNRRSILDAFAATTSACRNRFGTGRSRFAAGGNRFAAGHSDRRLTATANGLAATTNWSAASFGSTAAIVIVIVIVTTKNITTEPCAGNGENAECQHS